MTTTSPQPNDTETRLFHHPTGWTIPTLEPDPQDCTTNHTPDNTDLPPCTTTAVWKVVELHDMHATLSFWCDSHLPDEHGHLAARTAA